MMSLQLGETLSGFMVTETSSIGTPGGERSFLNKAFSSLPSPSPAIPFLALVPTFSTNPPRNACYMYAGYKFDSKESDKTPSQFIPHILPESDSKDRIQVKFLRGNRP